MPDDVQTLEQFFVIGRKSTVVVAVAMADPVQTKLRIWVFPLQVARHAPLFKKQNLFLQCICCGGLTLPRCLLQVDDAVADVVGPDSNLRRQVEMKAKLVTKSLFGNWLDLSHQF